VGNDKPPSEGVGLGELKTLIQDAVKGVIPGAAPRAADQEDINTIDCNKSRVARGFMWLDMVLSKTTKLVLYSLEGLGVFWLIHFIVQYNGAIDMARGAATPEALNHAKMLIDIITKAVESTSKVVIGLCTVLPAFIAALRTVRKVRETRYNYQNWQSTLDTEEGPDQPS